MYCVFCTPSEKKSLNECGDLPSNRIPVENLHWNFPPQVYLENDKSSLCVEDSHYCNISLWECTLREFLAWSFSSSIQSWSLLLLHFIVSCFCGTYICTTSMVQSYVVHHRPALCTTNLRSQILNVRVFFCFFCFCFCFLFFFTQYEG